MRTLRSATLLLFFLGLLAPTSGAVAADAKFSAPKTFTLALGDSLAFGFQEAKFQAALPDPDPAIFNTGFADVFAARVAATAPGKRSSLVNLACPGETTGSFLGSGPCLYNLAFRLHTEYGGAQIGAAEAFLAARPDQVSPILISLGANDALSVFDVCGLDASCIGAVMPGVLLTAAANLHQTLARLRAVAPAAEIILLEYYNPLAVIDLATNIVVMLLNQVIGDVAGAHRARVANAFPAFNLTPPPQTLCFLTLMCSDGDIHASDAGYAVIGNLMFEAAGYTRFEH
jgi:lysophospholipase L1-like esterase